MRGKMVPPSYETAREMLRRAVTLQEINVAIKLCAQAWVRENVR